MKKISALTLVFISLLQQVFAQTPEQDKVKLAPAPPMGWMTWNFFGFDFDENDVKQMTDVMVSSGMAAAGYQYIFIDDGWQGGRDNRNNMIPDPKKFPSGMKALADYVHGKGLKLGIYSDAAPLTCGGFTGSLHFEKQDAKTFASWDMDYLKYDYCGAPDDSSTAKKYYKTMAGALAASGRPITLGICEWGDRQPWFWAAGAGGSLWRISADIRDKWKRITGPGLGILDIIEINKNLHPHAGPGRWNDMDMLVIGLYGAKGPSSYLGGVGCTDVEYQTQMSMWCMMASPLIASNDLRKMNEATRNILTNKGLISINQDALGKQAVEKMRTEAISVFVKPLANGDFAVAVLNRSDSPQQFSLNLSSAGLAGEYTAVNLWSGEERKKAGKMRLTVAAHETLVYRLRP